MPNKKAEIDLTDTEEKDSKINFDIDMRVEDEMSGRQERSPHSPIIPDSENSEINSMKTNSSSLWIPYH